MTLNIILRLDGKEVKSFNTEDTSYTETGAICVASTVYGYDDKASRGSIIVFSSYSEVAVKIVNSLDDLK